MIRPIARLGLVVMMAAAFLPASVATAAVKNWTDGSGFWSVVGNWSGGSAPALNDTVNIVFADGTARTVTYNVAAPTIDLLSIDLIGAGATTSTLSLPGNINLNTRGIAVGGYSGTAPTVNGRGALTQSGGIVTTSTGGDLVLGFGDGSTGVYTLSGGAFVANLNEYVGLSGNGTFNHTAGSNTNASASGFFSVGHNAGSTGAYNLSGSGALVANSEYVGNSGTGVFNQTGGTNTIAAGHALYIGYNASATGTYNLSGGGIVTAPDVFVGYAGTGQSNFLITGAGSRVNTTASFVVARASPAYLTLAEGGRLSIGDGTGPLEIATLAGSSGAVLIGIGGAAGVLQASEVRFGVGSGFLEFNHTGNLTFATPIRGTAASGTVHKTGPGTTTLSGTNSYVGQTAVSGGTLAISADINLGTPPASFKQDQFQFFGGTLRATQDVIMHVNRGMEFYGVGGTIEVDATKTLTYSDSLDLSSGTMTKTGAGTLSLRQLRIGDSGSSELIVTGGGTLAVVGTSVIGDGSNISGTATISGPGNTWTSNHLYVGLDGVGTLEIDGGGAVTTTLDSVIAYSSGSTGTATVRGAGSTWNVGRSLTVDLGDGTLNIEDQGLVHVTNTLFISQGTVNLSGGTLRFNGYERSTVGTFNFNSGTIQLAGDRIVGADDAIEEFFSTSPIIPTGKGLTVEETATLTKAITLDGGTFTVGQLVNPSNLQLNRGTLNLTNQALTVGAGGLFGSTLDLHSDVTMNIALGIQNQGLVTGDGQLGGSFTNAVGGELRAEPGRSLKLTGSGNANSGQFNLLGGLVEFTQNLTNNAGGFISGNGSLIVRNGLVNHGTLNFSGTANILGDTTNAVGGKIISAGGGPTTFFDDVANQGEIRTTAGSYTVFFGSVTGAGTFAGPGAVNFEGDLKPGNSAAAIPFAGDVALGSDATLEIEIGGTTAGSQHDQINVAGELSLGGTLEVSLTGGFAPATGQSFDILNWGTLVGAFNSLELPTLAGMRQWNTSHLYTEGKLFVVSDFPGDYNNDDTVNAADYIVWRNNSGSGTSLLNDNTPGVGQDDYARWKSNYGSTTGSGSAADASANVPEPASLALLCLAISAMPLAVRRRSERKHSAP